MSSITFTAIETDRLNKVCAQLGITIETATSRHSNLEYGPLMARLIDMRDAAAFTARKDDTVTPNQRTSLEAHVNLATSRGDTDLVAKLDKLLTDFDATYSKASQALDICVRIQGKPASQFFPKRDNSNGSGHVAPAASIDISSVVMPEEAV